MYEHTKVIVVFNFLISSYLYFVFQFAFYFRLVLMILFFLFDLAVYYQ